ncbi:hypothetical protein GQ600_11752 [Phytophthora cactorum]|nr:hypothetical protein GQ600_11752 [Phytophthora cactorum]
MSVPQQSMPLFLSMHPSRHIRSSVYFEFECHDCKSTNTAATTPVPATTATPGGGGGTPGATVGAAADWRDKDADRSARQQIARIM